MRISRRAMLTGLIAAACGFSRLPHDDAPWIQAQIDRAHGQGEGYVMPSGKYHLGKTLRVQADTVIRDCCFTFNANAISY